MRDEIGDIGNVLWTAQIVLIDEAFHAQVPAPRMPKIDNLFNNDLIVLTSDGRHRAIGVTGGVAAMANDADLEKLATVDRIGARGERALPLANGD